MTTIFAFKVKNAWVLVADRFATERAYLTNEQFEDRPYQTLVVDIDKKIFNKDELVFSGCGDQDTITRTVHELSKNCSNLNECRAHIASNLGDSWFLQPDGHEIHLVDRPYLLIISKSEQEGIMVDFRKRDSDSKIKNIEQLIFLGGGEASINKALVKKEIIGISNKDIGELSEVAIQCAKWLDSLWLGLHKNDLKLTGPASFIGCDVCIIKEDSCKIVNVAPKDYELV